MSTPAAPTSGTARPPHRPLGAGPAPGRTGGFRPADGTVGVAAHHVGPAPARA